MANKRKTANTVSSVLAADSIQLLQPELIKRSGREPNVRDFIDQVPHVELRNELMGFVDHFDLTKAKTFDDVARGFQGLLALNFAVGHVPRMHKMIELGAKILTKYADTKRSYLEVDFPDELEHRMGKGIEDLIEALEVALGPDSAAKIKEVLLELSQAKKKN
jgi:hypothetical protein